MSFKVSFNGTSANQPVSNQAKKPQKRVLTDEEKQKIKKNKIIAYASFIGTIAVCFIVTSVGRNPAKAAKVAQGTLEMNNKIYQEAVNYVQELFSGQGDFEIGVDSLEKIFEIPENITPLNQKIAQAEKYLEQAKVPEDAKVWQNLQTLKKNLQLYINNIQYTLSQGAQRDSDLSKKFEYDNGKLMSEICEFFEDERQTELAREFRWFKYGDLFPEKYITECPAELLPEDRIFYHGTRNASKVYKNGFTPFVSNQLSKNPRELGAGIYATPDIRVAASFSDFTGDIIPIRLPKDAKIALVTQDSYAALNKKINEFLLERVGKEAFQAMPKEKQNAILECLTRELFMRAGYDAAYIPKGVRSGGGIFGLLFNPDVNEVIGTAQKQVIIFSSEKTQIQQRSLKERIGDMKYKYDACKAKASWAKDHPFGF